MTKPTPAQIEAAAKVLYAREKNEDDPDWDDIREDWKVGLRLDAKAALAAAIHALKGKP